MNHESVSFITRNTFPKLLKRPIGRRVARDVEIRQFARANFHNEEDVNQWEPRRHHDEELASDDGSGVIAHKRHPALL